MLSQITSVLAQASPDTDLDTANQLTTVANLKARAVELEETLRIAKLATVETTARLDAEKARRKTVEDRLRKTESVNEYGILETCCMINYY
jgi:hypothetical protein